MATTSDVGGEIAVKRVRRPNQVRADCHPERAHRSHGLCDPCLGKKVRREHPERYLATARRYRAKNMALMVARNRLKKLGVTAEAFATTLLAQGGVCAICRGDSGPTDFHADHDHATGRFRGALCGACNRAIGFMRDDPDRLRSAAAYLERRLVRIA